MILLIIVAAYLLVASISIPVMYIQLKREMTRKYPSAGWDNTDRLMDGIISFAWSAAWPFGWPLCLVMSR